MPSLKIFKHLVYFSPSFDRVLLYTPLQEGEFRQYFQINMKKQDRYEWIHFDTNIEEKEKLFILNLVKMYGFLIFFHTILEDFSKIKLKKNIDSSSQNKNEGQKNTEIQYSETNKTEIFLILDISLEELFKIFEHCFPKMFKNDSYFSKKIKISIPFYLVNAKL